MTPDPSEEEKIALVDLLKRTVEADHYPLLLRILTLKDILDKRATPTSCRSCETSSPRGGPSLDDTPRRNGIVRAG
jgi:hypothetical protein